MRQEYQHEVVRDATLTFAHILKTQLPPNLESKKAVDVVFDVPTPKRQEEAKEQGKILLSVILIDSPRSTLQQSTDQPIIREEDQDGNILEYKLAPPTYIMPRYLVTPWAADVLENQVIMGLVMKVFFSRDSFMPEDIQGQSISAEQKPAVMMVDSFGLEKQMKLWEVMGHPYKPSMVYAVNLRMDSMAKTFVRRVKERVLDFKKLEG